MSTKKPSKKEGLRLLSQMSKRAFQNGIDFYNDALLIFTENGSYGHAFGLLVLAEEEFAKTWLLHTFHEMIKNDISYFSEDKEALKISDIISDHKKKQRSLEFLGKATVVLMYKFKQPPPDNISEEKALQIIKEITDEIDNPTDEELKRIFANLERNYQSMQTNREKGFYVGIDKNNRKIIAPDQITQNECEQQFRKTRFSLALCNIWREIKIPKKQAPMLKKILKTLDTD